MINFHSLSIEDLNSPYFPFIADAELTDLAKIKGVTYRSNMPWQRKPITGNYWAKEIKGSKNAYIIGDYGTVGYTHVNEERIGIRPVCSYSSIKEQVISSYRDYHGILTVLYGYYPQNVVNREIEELLKKCPDNVYINNNTMYVKVKVNRLLAKYPNNNYKIVLSNNEIYYNDEEVWLEVKPIEWQILEDKDLAVAKNILTSGISYHEIDKFLNTEFASFLLNNPLNQSDILIKK